MNNDTEAKKWVCEVLKQLGLTPELIPVSNQRRTPDLKATDGKDIFLIEVKSKIDDPSAVSAEAEKLRSGQPVVQSIPVSHNNTLSDIIRDAADQLKYSKVPEAIRLLWFNAEGGEPERQWRQLYSTLYGTRTLVDTTTNAAYECFYFDFNEFFHRKDIIDAAFTAWPENGLTKLALFVNSFSPRVERVRNCTLYKALHEGLCDPRILESEGRAYLADTDVDRRNSDAVLKYIQDKYNNPNLSAFPALSYITGKVPFGAL